MDRGFVYLTGVTSSSDFPISNALYPTRTFGTLTGFVAKMNTDGSSFVYSTYLSGTSDVEPTDILTDKGCVIVTGHTGATDYPITSGHTYSCDPSSVDSFVTKFSLDGQELLYSTCFGGTDSDRSRAVDAYDGRLYVAGYTDSDDYPTIVAYNETPGGSTDGFVTIFDIDTDFDALPDFTESVIGTNPHAVDSDGDNFLDAYEFYYGSDPLDSGSYPAIPQTWYDAIYENLDGNSTLIQNLIAWSDGNATELQLVVALVTANYEWLQELNSTALGNITEIRSILDQLGVTVGDLDYDGLDDLDELFYGTDLDCIDTDIDNLNDAFEIKLGTDPLDDDSDDDTYFDGFEVLSGTDPLDPDDYPGMETSTTTTTGTTTPTTPLPGDEPPLVLILAIGSGAGVIGIVVVLAIMKKRRASG